MSLASRRRLRGVMPANRCSRYPRQSTGIQRKKQKRSDAQRYEDGESSRDRIHSICDSRRGIGLPVARVGDHDRASVRDEIMQIGKYISREIQLPVCNAIRVNRHRVNGQKCRFVVGCASHPGRIELNALDCGTHLKNAKFNAHR